MRVPKSTKKSEDKSVVNLRNFGEYIGYSIPRTTLSNFIAKESTLRQVAELLPVGSKYIVNRKNRIVEEVLVLWLQDQRSRHVPVDGKMIKEAAQVTYTVLVDSFDPDDLRGGVVPSFSTSWFDAFKKRYRISYHQLYGEAGGVDLEAIEPRLREIRAVCATYPVDDIYNCDETGVYLKELVTRSYTIPEEKSGVKANRSCRVSILFCVNASGSSLALAEREDMSALRPLVIGNVLILLLFFL